MRFAKLAFVCLMALGFARFGMAQQLAVRGGYRIGRVTQDTVYLEAGSNAGLDAGQQLEVKRRVTVTMASGDGTAKATRLIARLTVISVTETSAHCRITWIEGTLHAGDTAAFPAEDVKALLTLPAPAATRQTPAPTQDGALDRQPAELASRSSFPVQTAQARQEATPSQLARANVAENIVPGQPPKAEPREPVAQSQAVVKLDQVQQQPIVAQQPARTPLPEFNAASRATRPLALAVPPQQIAQSAAPAKVRQAEIHEPASPPIVEKSLVEKTVVARAQPEPREPEAIPAHTPVNVPAPAPPSDVRTQFRVKYVAEGAVYLEGGRAAGLEEGQKLEIRHKETPTADANANAAKSERVVARLEIVSVAEGSAVAEVRGESAELHAGDVATLSDADLRAQVERRSFSAQRSYLQVITFSEGDPLDEEVRDFIPKPPSPAVNRARGRIGFEYGGISSASSKSADVGVVLRADVSRIGGTFWNFSGYWRGRMNSRSSGSQPQTLTDLINRTYHLSLDYVSPRSRWVAGFGRLYVPWASSLNTIDGGYFGRRVGGNAVAGIFAGTTPDPTSWNYNPNRRIGGAFVNFEGGSFNTSRYSTTIGAGVSMLRWQMERPFSFLENSLFFGHKVSIYNSVEVDKPRVQNVTGSTLGVSRSYVTLRIQPHSRIAFDVNHNYFRDYATFDPQLVGTGLLDKLLFQGLSGGVRVDLPYCVGVYVNVGRSSQTGDARSSWNQLFGLTLGEIPWAHVRADLRYSKFDSAFGRGQYRSLAFSREFGEGFRWEVMGGEQRFVSPLSQQSNSRFLTSHFDWFLGSHYFMGSGLTIQRGLQQDYEQWFVNLGYRF